MGKCCQGARPVMHNATRRRIGRAGNRYKVLHIRVLFAIVSGGTIAPEKGKRATSTGQIATHPSGQKMKIANETTNTTLTWQSSPCPKSPGLASSTRLRGAWPVHMQFLPRGKPFGLGAASPVGYHQKLPTDKRTREAQRS
ncbi:hypothetical protein CLAIMM_04586 [Cladophialophora immunda]|nr:hypothetical protein CLAIMM_04586 [Cladophialophora immunda]